MGVSLEQGVGGAQPPPRLDTYRETLSSNPPQGVSQTGFQRNHGGPLLPDSDPSGVSSGPSGVPSGPSGGSSGSSGVPSGVPSRQQKRFQRRHRLARPSKADWETWMDAYADALEELGWREGASNARSCGRQVFVSACGACGEQNASVRVSLHCDLRACPHCARRHAADRARTLIGAALRVSGYVAARAVEHLSSLECDLSKARDAVDYWTTRRDRAADRASRARSSSVREKELASVAANETKRLVAEDRRRGLQWDRSRAGEWKTWKWSLVTISPPWNPEDPRELTVEGLKRRIDDIWERWDRVWKRLSAGGLAAATARLEISAHGHVHVHALVFGPFVLNETLRKSAGCIVDRPALALNGDTYEKALADLVREAAKYAVKAPSPSGYGFVTGDSEHGNSLHPETAARWTFATHRAQTIRHYGTMRDAVSAEIAAQPKGEVGDDLERQSAPRCPCCGADALLPATIRRTVDVARELGADAWKRGWHGIESPPSARLTGAGDRLPPRVGYFWRDG